MTQFTYTALDAAGVFTKGRIDGRSLKKATRLLEQQGCLIVNIKRENTRTQYDWNSILKRVSRNDRIFFTRHVYTLLESGIGLDQALKITIDQTSNVTLKTVLTDIHKRILAGESFNSALAQHPKYFNTFFVNLVKVGERSGKLDEVLLHILDQQEKDNDLITKVRGAMIYPAVIVTAAVCIVTFMMIFVVPQITNILTEYNVQLPLTTRILIAVSNILSYYGIVLIPALLIGIPFLARLWVKNPRGKRQWDVLKLRIPLVKKIVSEFNLARIFRAMSALLKSGISIDQALELSASVSNNTLYQESLRAAIKFVHKGIPLTEIFNGNPKLYPPISSRMIEIGERSGRLDHMFDRLANFYEKSVATTLMNLSTIIEPLLLLFIGFVVGLIGLAILTPIWKFSQTI